MASSSQPGEASDIPAVFIRDANKGYGRKKKHTKILKKLNMTVMKGTIYGLLGPSGCGKTTLLSCIIGIKKLDSGEIYVLGGTPGTRGSGIPGPKVGYMPQEIALFLEFSIIETFRYFGWIYGMRNDKIDQRCRFLLNFLVLPDGHRLVKNLSGGQQRRVSFACALIHDPELLILDEPTVGVDPVLRAAIWEHLISIAKLGQTTVIITTHYIEEANEAHAIGLMRNGRLLAEAAPAVLIKEYGTKNLEEVFFKLSQLNAKELEDIEDKLRRDKRRYTEKAVYDSASSEYYTRSFLKDVCCYLPRCCGDANLCGKLRALLTKCSLKILRNAGLLLFMFVLPIVQISIFCVAIGADPIDLQISVVNMEKNDTSIPCKSDPGCATKNLGCRYLSYLDGSFILIYYSDLEQAKKSVLNGTTHGVIYINENFSEKFVMRGMQGNAIKGDDLEQSEVKVQLDMSEQQIGYFLLRILQLGFKKFAEDLAGSCGMNAKAIGMPLVFEKPIFGDENPSFDNFVAPGLLITIIFFLAVSLTSIAMIQERAEGLLDRSYIAGVTPGEVLFAHVLTQFFIVAGQTVLALIFLLAVFKVKQEGQLLTVVSLALGGGLCGMCYGLFISAICASERAAMQIALGSFYPSLLLSGIIWPIEGMNYYLQIFAKILPLTMPINAGRAVFLRGDGMYHFVVYMGFVSIGVWILFFLILSLVFMNKN